MNILFICSRNQWPIEVLDIPDEYQYMAPDLVEIFEELAADFLNRPE